MLFVLISLLLHIHSNFIPSDKMQSEEWIVPDSAKSLENPTDKEDQDDLAYGLTLYNQHCKSCHGKKGLGDGSAAKNLQTHIPDFSQAKFQLQTDGSLFHKISNGRNEMPEFVRKMPDDEDRWLIVNYLRTLEEK